MEHFPGCWIIDEDGMRKAWYLLDIVESIVTDGKSS
jgi:hypothetical protein